MKEGQRRGQNVPWFRDQSRPTDREAHLLDKCPEVGLKILSKLISILPLQLMSSRGGLLLLRVITKGRAL